MAVKYGEPETDVTRWWVRWYGLPDDSFEYEGPWWISGFAGTEDMTPIFVAAVVADNVEAAKKVIESSYDDGPAGVHEWSFVNGRPDNWEPFCDRFPRAKWMKWPYPAAAPASSAGTPAKLARCGHVAYRDHDDACIVDGCPDAAYQVVAPADVGPPGKPTPYSLWKQSGENHEKYGELLLQHGYVTMRPSAGTREPGR